MRAGQVVRSYGAVVALGVVLLSGCAPIEGRETAGQYVGDAKISTEIRGDLVKDQALKAFQINVHTMQGVVQLSGFVDSRAQKDEAGRVAESIDGVRQVDNNIVVRSPTAG